MRVKVRTALGDDCLSTQERREEPAWAAREDSEAAWSSDSEEEEPELRGGEGKKPAGKGARGAAWRLERADDLRAQGACEPKVLVLEAASTLHRDDGERLVGTGLAQCLNRCHEDGEVALVRVGRHLGDEEAHRGSEADGGASGARSELFADAAKRSAPAPTEPPEPPCHAEVSRFLLLAIGAEFERA